MEGKTHIVGGVAAGSILLYTSNNLTPDTLFMAGCIAGSMLPDICHPNSKIGRRLPLLSFLVSKSFGHRTFTHSLLFLVGLVLLFQAVSLPGGLEQGILIGAASHLFLDFLTDQGIQFFYPFSIRVRSPLHITTGGIFETGILAALILFVGFMGYEMYL